jgi:excisionase family DNA binding protein
VSEGLLTPKQLAAEAGVTERQIYRLVAAGKLASVRFSPRGSIHIAREDWARCVQRHRQEVAEQTRPRADISDLPGASRYTN